MVVVIGFGGFIVLVVVVVVVVVIWMVVIDSVVVVIGFCAFSVALLQAHPTDFQTWQINCGRVGVVHFA